MYQPTHRTCFNTVSSAMYPTHTHTLSTVPKYHRCFVDSITSVSHDSKLFSLRLPTGSYLNVPTGHHLAIRADVDGKLLCTACACVYIICGRCPTGAGILVVVAVSWVCGRGFEATSCSCCSYVKAIECLIYMQVFPTLYAVSVCPIP